MDPKGEYIKEYLPKLKNIPKKYIHSYMLHAWLALKEAQKEGRCVTGTDHPKSVVDMCT